MVKSQLKIKNNRIIMNNKIAVLITGIVFLLSPNTYAVTGTLDVSSEVKNACSIGSGATIAFGVYDPASASTSTTGTSLNIICNGPTVAWRIHSTQSVVTRLMKRTGGTETLLYTLTNSADTALAVTDTTGSETGIGSKVAIIKGTIAAGQNVVPGFYTQQISLTILFWLTNSEVEDWFY
jgi:spore coat protein U-like protein